MKLVTAAVTAVLAIAAAGPAFAVTVKNNSNVEINTKLSRRGSGTEE